MSTFLAAFERQQNRIQRRLSLRSFVRTFSVACAVSALPLYLVRLWQPHLSLPFGVGLLCASSVVAGVLTFRTRWSKQQIALYLDAAYESHETITTAEEETRSPTPSPTLLKHAVEVLGTPARLPLLARKRDAAALVGPCLVLASLLLPLPKASAHALTVPRVKVKAETLDPVIALGKLREASPEERARLGEIAKQAEKLKADLEQGLTEQEALDRIGRLQESLRNERQMLGSGERKQGLESAAARLAETEATRKLAEALRDRDLTAFDKEMERLANEREKADRDAAKQALREAIKQAERNGAPDVAKALQSELKSFEEREARNEQLRALGDAIEKLRPKTSELKQRAEAFKEHPTDANAKELAQAMEKALQDMTPEEREQLAKNLARLSDRSNAAEDKGDAGAPGKPMSPEEIAQMLKELGSKDLRAPEADVDEHLQKGEEGARETQRSLIPRPSEQGQGQQGQGQAQQGGQQGQGQAQQGQGGKGTQGNKPGEGGKGGTPGHSEDTGTGDHKGQTDAVPTAGDMKARARAQKNAGAPVPGGFTVLGQGHEPGSVAESRSGDLRSVSGKELRSIDQSEIPNEYREQLHEYFKP